MKRQEKIVILGIGAAVVPIMFLMMAGAGMFSGDVNISEEEAKSIAEEHTGGPATSVDVEKEDGKTVYEVQVETAEGPAEVEIDAHSGEVLEVEHGEDDD